MGTSPRGGALMNWLKNKMQGENGNPLIVVLIVIGAVVSVVWIAKHL
jgi:hypothetical protein